MSPNNNSIDCQTSSFPRVSGDEPWNDGVVAYYSVFSPRERG